MTTQTDKKRWNEDKILTVIMDVLRESSYPDVVTCKCKTGNAVDDCESTHRIMDDRLPKMVIDLLPKLYRMQWLGRVHIASHNQPDGKTLRYYTYYLI